MNSILDERELTDLVEHYEPLADADAKQRWRRLFDVDEAGPIVLVNRFKLRASAAYPDGRTGSGQEAFAAYASVSMPALARVGGRFLASAPPAVGVFGESPDADLIAIGWYPDRSALLELFRDEQYREAFEHRRAALLVDEVVAVNGLPL